MEYGCLGVSSFWSSFVCKQQRPPRIISEVSSDYEREKKKKKLKMLYSFHASTLEKGERERERERERETDRERETERERQSQPDRQPGKQTDRQTDRTSMHTRATCYSRGPVTPPQNKS